jgi:hypothetical protein
MILELGIHETPVLDMNLLSVLKTVWRQAPLPPKNPLICNDQGKGEGMS